MSEVAAERARIARELHDGLAQNLAAIGYSLDAEIGRSDTSADSRAALRQIRERVTELNSTVRNEIFKLRSIRSASPHSELQKTVIELEIPVQIKGELADDEIGATLSKVLQELLRNAKAHTSSPSMNIDITATEISIRNSGVGNTAAKPDRYGVIGLRERLSEIGWSITQSSDFTLTQLQIKR